MIVKIGVPVRALRETKNKVKKVYSETKTCDNLTSHVFAEITHIVVAPYEFARVVISVT